MENYQASKQMDKEYIDKLKALLNSQIAMDNGMTKLMEESPRKEMVDTPKSRMQEGFIELQQMSQRCDKLPQNVEQLSGEGSQDPFE